MKHSAASPQPARTMNMRRPVWSATQPQILGETILVAITRAIRVPMSRGSKPRDLRYRDQYGISAPREAK